jgi:hypothetical protein
MSSYPNQFQNHNTPYYGNVPPQQPGGFHPSSPYGNFPPQSSYPPPSSPPVQGGISKGKKIAIVVAVIIVCGAAITFLTNRTTSPPDRHQTPDDLSSSSPPSPSNKPKSSGPKNSPSRPKSEFEKIYDSLEKAIYNVKKRDFLKAFAKNQIKIEYFRFDELKAQLEKNGILSNEDSKFCFDFLYNFTYFKWQFDKGDIFDEREIRRLMKVEPILLVYGIPWDYYGKVNTILLCEHLHPENDTLLHKLFEKILQIPLKHSLSDTQALDLNSAILDEYHEELLTLHYRFPQMRSHLDGTYKYNTYQRDRIFLYISQVWDSNLLLLMIDRAEDISKSEDIFIDHREFAENMQFDVTKFKIPLEKVKRFVSPGKDFSKLPIIQGASPTVVSSIYNDYMSSNQIAAFEFIPSILQGVKSGSFNAREKDFGRTPAYIFEALKKKIEESSDIFTREPVSLSNMNFLIYSSLMVELGAEKKIPDDYPEKFYKICPLLLRFGVLPVETAVMRTKVGQCIFEKFKDKNFSLEMKGTVDRLLACVSPDSLPAFYKENYEKLLPLCYCIPKLNELLKYSDEEFELIRKFFQIIWDLELLKAVGIRYTSKYFTNDDDSFVREFQFNPYTFIPDLKENSYFSFWKKFDRTPILTSLADLKSYNLSETSPQV